MEEQTQSNSYNYANPSCQFVVPLQEKLCKMLLTATTLSNSRNICYSVATDLFLESPQFNYTGPQSHLS